MKIHSTIGIPFNAFPICFYGILKTLQRHSGFNKISFYKTLWVVCTLHENQTSFYQYLQGPRRSLNLPETSYTLPRENKTVPRYLNRQNRGLPTYSDKEGSSGIGEVDWSPVAERPLFPPTLISNRTISKRTVHLHLGSLR